MKELQAGNLLPNVAISLVAGALGCMAVLMVAHGLGMQVIPAPAPASMSAGQGASVASGAAANQPGIIADSSVADPAGADPTVLQLRQALKTATDERAQLSATVVTLNRQLLEIEARVTALSEQDEVRVDAVDSEDTGAEDDAPVDALSARLSPSEQQFQGLVAAGLDEQSARDLQSRLDRYQLARLELFDQAAREGWEDSGQLRDSLEELELNRPDLREELGDSLYDQYLYEAGDSNRIAIDSVIAGSAASEAGLQRGDLIISYGDARTFSVGDLQEATRSGSRGESVQVVFEREGQTLTTDMLRGPLGVTLRSTRQQP